MHKPFTLFVLLMLLSTSLAQAPFVQQYYASDLALVPGDIRLTPGYSTILEFYNTVDLIVTGQPDLFTIDDLGSRIVLNTSQRQGHTDLFVEVNGRSLLFEITIEVEDQITRLYRIERERTRAFAPARPLLPTAPYAAQGAAVQAPVPVQGAAVQAPLPVQAVTAETAVTAYGTSGAGELSFTPSGFDSEGNYIVFFSYRNTSPSRVALDPNRLSASNEGGSYTLRVTKQPLRNLVSPGEIQNGLVSLQGVAPGTQVNLNWAVVVLSAEGGQEQILGESLYAR